MSRVPAAGQKLEKEHVGPAHILVRHTLARVHEIDPESIQFESPLRIGKPLRLPRGNDLLDRAWLRQLLTWLDPAMRPQLAVVLVDRDGRKGRRGVMQGHLEEPRRVPSVWVIAVVIEEFEAWLLADLEILRKILSHRPSIPGGPETLAPGNAKRLLFDAVHSAGSGSGLDEKAVRRRIAEECDLDLLARTCSAFQQFRADLKLLSL